MSLTIGAQRVNNNNNNNNNNNHNNNFYIDNNNNNSSYGNEYNSNSTTHGGDMYYNNNHDNINNNNNNNNNNNIQEENNAIFLMHLYKQFNSQFSQQRQLLTMINHLKQRYTYHNNAANKKLYQKIGQFTPNNNDFLNFCSQTDQKQYDHHQKLLSMANKVGLTNNNNFFDNENNDHDTTMTILNNNNNNNNNHNNNNNNNNTTLLPSTQIAMSSSIAAALDQITSDTPFPTFLPLDEEYTMTDAIHNNFNCLTKTTTLHPTQIYNQLTTTEKFGIFVPSVAQQDADLFDVNPSLKPIYQEYHNILVQYHVILRNNKIDLPSCLSSFVVTDEQVNLRCLRHVRKLRPGFSSSSDDDDDSDDDGDSDDDEEDSNDESDDSNNEDQSDSGSGTEDNDDDDKDSSENESESDTKAKPRGRGAKNNKRAPAAKGKESATKKKVVVVEDKKKNTKTAASRRKSNTATNTKKQTKKQQQQNKNNKKKQQQQKKKKIKKNKPPKFPYLDLTSLTTHLYHNVTPQDRIKLMAFDTRLAQLAKRLPAHDFSNPLLYTLPSGYYNRNAEYIPNNNPDGVLHDMSNNNPNLFSKGQSLSCFNLYTQQLILDGYYPTFAHSGLFKTGHFAAIFPRLSEDLDFFGGADPEHVAPENMVQNHFPHLPTQHVVEHNDIQVITPAPLAPEIVCDVESNKEAYTCTLPKNAYHSKLQQQQSTLIQSAPEVFLSYRDCIEHLSMRLEKSNNNNGSNNNHNNIILSDEDLSLGGQYCLNNLINAFLAEYMPKSKAEMNAMMSEFEVTAEDWAQLHVKSLLSQFLISYRHDNNNNNHNTNNNNNSRKTNNNNNTLDNLLAIPSPQPITHHPNLPQSLISNFERKYKPDINYQLLAPTTHLTAMTECNAHIVQPTVSPHNHSIMPYPVGVVHKESSGYIEDDMSTVQYYDVVLRDTSAQSSTQPPTSSLSSISPYSSSFFSSSHPEEDATTTTKTNGNVILQTIGTNPFTSMQDQFNAITLHGGDDDTKVESKDNLSSPHSAMFDEDGDGEDLFAPSSSSSSSSTKKTTKASTKLTKAQTQPQYCV